MPSSSVLCYPVQVGSLDWTGSSFDKSSQTSKGITLSESVLNCYTPEGLVCDRRSSEQNKIYSRTPTMMKHIYCVEGW
jgi:hypothetical protein